MTKIRVLIFLLTLIIVGIGGYIALMYARGYRINPKNGELTPHGLLAVKSNPDGAQIFIDQELKSATNTTFSLPPAKYDIEIKKEGYKNWSKTITLKKEEVTEIDASLFKNAPSLSALTFDGSINPIASTDQSKIAYAVLPENKSDFSQKAGLWIVETINLPIGFSREARRITDGDFSKATWTWSPDGREILVTTPTATYLLNSGTFTPQGQRVNVTASKNTTLIDWSEQEKKRLDSKLNTLPDELSSILKSKAKSILFSPDENMVIYTASGSATLPENLIRPLPGSSTQTEERKIENGNTYLYDIKEDKNFLIDSDSTNLILGNKTVGGETKKIIWYPNSRNIVLSEENNITIIDYDGTNRQKVYNGMFTNPFVFTTGEDRLLILTNLGGSDSPNLYTLTIK
jgi:dipeptidyl aminopeptidase/acylaminoacyl peptidase